MAVPVRNGYGIVHGVLITHFLKTSDFGNKIQEFSRENLKTLQLFGKTIATAIQNDLTRQRKDFLLELWSNLNITEVFSKIIKFLPKVIPASYCIILGSNSEEYGENVTLVASSVDLHQLNYPKGKGKNRNLRFNKKDFSNISFWKKRKS